MGIKNLRTIDEVLHYGSISEVEITSREDWDHLSRLMLEAGADCYEAGMEYIRDTEGSDADYECGVEDGYREGYQDCLDNMDWRNDAGRSVQYFKKCCGRTE